MDFVSLFVSSLPNQSVFYIFVNGCIWLTWGLFNYYVILQGGRGVSKNMILYYMGEKGGGLERGQIVLHNN